MVVVAVGLTVPLLYLSKGEFHTTNRSSETVLIKSPVVMCEPYNDAFTALLFLGGLDEDAEVYRHNGVFDFKRNVGLFTRFEVREFKNQLPIFNMRRFRSGQVESVKSTTVTNAMSCSEAVAHLHEIKNLLIEQHIGVSFIEEQKGCNECGIRSERRGKEGWNIYMSARKVDRGGFVLELLLKRCIDFKQSEVKDVQVDVDI